MSITWTKLFTSSDDGSILTGSQVGTLQNDISTQVLSSPVTAANAIDGASLTNLGNIVSGAGVIPVANIPTGAIPTNYRSQLYCMQASTTTMTVAPGFLEINNKMVSITTNTTLTLTTAGNWAGGSSLQAVSTTGYVGVDASGNIKMHTTAPAFADYALTISAANSTKRYVSWSSTTYRVIGWFRMNATGSGQLDTYGVSNLADGSVKNVVEFETGAMATGTTAGPTKSNNAPQNTSGDQFMSLNFVPTNANNKLKITVVTFGADTEGTWQTTCLYQDSTAGALASGVVAQGTASVMDCVNFSHYMKAGTTSLTTFKVRCGGISGTYTFNGYSSTAALGGTIASSIRIEEIESQLT